MSQDSQPSQEASVSLTQSPLYYPTLQCTEASVLIKFLVSIRPTALSPHFRLPIGSKTLWLLSLTGQQHFEQDGKRESNQ